MLGLLPREQSKTSAAFPSLHKPTVTLTRLKNDASDAGRLKYSGASLPSITPLWGEQSPSPKQGEQDAPSGAARQRRTHARRTTLLQPYCRALSGDVGHYKVPACPRVGTLQPAPEASRA